MTERGVRATIAEAVLNTDGNLARAAHQLGVGRRHLTRLVREHYLWPFVNRVREVARLEPKRHPMIAKVRAQLGR
jgi:transposase-like protein